MCHQHKILIAILLLTAATASADDPSGLLLPDGGEVPATRDAFYCQSSWVGSVNASSGYDSEVADDIPDEFTGWVIDKIVLYVAEWMGTWVDPYGIAVNLYNSECPPDLEPTTHMEFDWAELSPVLEYHSPSFMTVYKVTATLPTPVVIEEEMSIGAYVLQDWGTNPPFCGFWFTPEDSVYGCGELYLDYQSGAPRWTAFLNAAPSGYYSDLTYCLIEASTSVGEAQVDSSEIQTWGEIKEFFR